MFTYWGCRCLVNGQIMSCKLFVLLIGKRRLINQLMIAVVVARRLVHINLFVFVISTFQRFHSKRVSHDLEALCIQQTRLVNLSHKSVLIPPTVWETCHCCRVIKHLLHLIQCRRPSIINQRVRDSNLVRCARKKVIMHCWYCNIAFVYLRGIISCEYLVNYVMIYHVQTGLSSCSVLLE